MMKWLWALALVSVTASGQISTPQINLSGNIGCQGFPCLNSGTLIMATDADRTMTAVETSAINIKVISSVSLTATRNLNVPVGRFSFAIENATTGGQSLQVIGSSGSGVIIPAGQTVSVWNDGTNFVQIGVGGSGGSGVSSLSAAPPIYVNTSTGAVTVSCTGCVYLSGTPSSSLPLHTTSSSLLAVPAAIALASADVSGILPTLNGGTGSSITSAIGHMLFGQSSGAYLDYAVSGSCTVSATGVFTCSGGGGNVNTGTAGSPTCYASTTNVGNCTAAVTFPNDITSQDLFITNSSTPAVLYQADSTGSYIHTFVQSSVDSVQFSNTANGYQIKSAATSAASLTISSNGNVQINSLAGTGNVLAINGVSGGTTFDSNANETTPSIKLTGLTPSTAALCVPAAGGLVTNSGCAGGGGPVYSGNLATGILADYDCSAGACPGTGTTLIDDSGANACSGGACNGTFGGGSATSPAWVGKNAVQFSSGTDGITLPATLNTARTFIFATYETPITLLPGGTVYNTGYGPILSSSTGASGLNLIYSAPCTGGSAFGLALYNSGCTTVPFNSDGGMHVWQITLGDGTTGNITDQICLDGICSPSTSYGTQGSSSGAQSSGNLFIGTSNTGPWGGAGGNWQLYHLRVLSTELNTTTDAQLANTIFRQQVLARGNPVLPIPQKTTTPYLFGIGDSQMSGQGVTTPFVQELTLTNQPAYIVQNWGVGGSRLFTASSSEDWRVAPKCPSQFNTPSVALVLYGTNDMTGLSGTPSANANTVYTYMGTIVKKLMAGGCLVFISPMYSRYGTDGGSNTYDADKDALNTLYRQNWKAMGAQGLIDLPANPLIGADGAAPTGGNTYFQSGGLHLTQAGTDLVAAEASNALNYYFGASASSPTQVTAATYTMLAKDASVEFTGTASSAFTLPTCLGQTGAVYTVNDLTAFALTITGALSTQPINGLASSLFTIPAYSAQQFTDVANSSVTAGCHWDAATPPPALPITTQASAGTVALSLGTTTISGTAAIATFTPPTGWSATSGGCLPILATGAWTTTTAGNIFATMTAVANTPYCATWNGTKFYIK